MKPSKTQLPAFFFLLALAFGAGILVAGLLVPSAPPASVSEPAAPTALPPSPTPPLTPTPTALERGDVLTTLYIDIDPDDLAQIAAKRQEALALGILLADDADLVPATIRLDGAEIPVELRLKGDWMDHYAHEKWSFRVITRRDGYVFGMQTFSLQDPSTRSYLNEWLFLENLRLEDVLGVRYHFVHVVLNGEYMGIYALEEAFARELFEAQERREGVILRYDEDLVWSYRAFYDDWLIPRGVNDFYVIDEFESGRIDADPALAAQRDVAFGLLSGFWTGELTAGEVFDLEAMGRFLALNDLWNAQHGLIWHNLRYYYNPVTARLEPIGFDAHPLAADLDPEMVGLPPSAFYDDPQLQAATARELARISQPGYVEALEATLGPQFEAFRATLAPEFGEGVLSPPWDALRRRQALIRQTLDPYQTVYATAWQPAPSGAISVSLGNLLNWPVEWLGFEVGGRFVPADAGWVAPESAGWVVLPPAGTPGAVILRALPSDAASMPYVTLNVPAGALGAADLPTLVAVTRLWGLTDTHTSTVVLNYPPPLATGPRPDAPTVEQALAQHPYLRLVEGTHMFEIAAGVWDVAGDLVLPEGFGLRLGPGTTLRFGAENALFATAALDFQGTEGAPVLLQPQGDLWRGVVVLEAGAPSTWRYVTVTAADALDRDGWTLTGALTFYESPIRLEHCHILDSPAEDGINVIHTTFAFVHSEFGRTASDAFDADFAQGVVEDCSFHHTGGDGIDVSGSEVTVARVRLLDIGDKAISVGEASYLTAADVVMERVRFGLVSKDRSHAVLTGATIASARTAALAAYVKKPAYGPASIEAGGITFVDTPPERRTLVQTGSWIDLEGVRIWGVDVDVAALYDGE
ncbi:MAG: CotH kinase family protein [Anaerolineae bacterium]|nr:CotH kinase family protein [Anaerolineae bacterium]